jgi:hypothetical protein
MGLQTGESVWVRVLRMVEGSKIRYWVHNEELDRDMEEHYLYFMIIGRQLVQVTEQVWRSYHSPA